jgi:serine/threonine-protein kinase
VPNVIGQTEEAARTALSEHFKPTKGEDTSGPCFGGAAGVTDHVCTMTPAPNADAKDGAVITYHLYKQGTVTVPYVEGKSYADALQMLNQNHLKGARRWRNATDPRGTVLSQSQDAYARVAPGTTITLTVSTGVLKLPDVKGKSFDDAQNQLNHIGFNNVVQDSTPQETHDQSKDGTVADMSPSPGNTYDPGQKITLKLFHYVPAGPTCTPVGTGSPSGGPTGGTSSSTSPPPTGGASGSSSSTLPPC